MQLGVSVLFSPKAERDGSQFVNQGLSEAVLGEVNRLHVGPATVAALHSNIGEDVGSVDRKFGVIFLAAAGADDAAKLPLRKAETADQATPATVALLPQNPERRSAIAKRTHRMGIAFELQPGPRADELSVGLQERESQELTRLDWHLHSGPAFIEQVSL